jgi:hypothetical protein
MNFTTTSQQRAGGLGVILMLAFVFILGAVSFGLMIFNPRGATSAPVDDRSTADALAAAKAALLGYAVSRGDATTAGQARPGDLPCPDTDNDGRENLPCNAGALGRIPWRDLGIPDLKDSAGETLWYAIAGPLRSRAAGNGDRINSNVRGNLRVLAPDGASIATNEAIAVIFSAGQTIDGQNRGSAVVACATTGTNIRRDRCAANYLDGANATGDGTAAKPFIIGLVDANGRPVQTFNDRVLYVEMNEMIPALETRVGNELRNLLIAYRNNSVCQCFPWADSWDYSGGIADVGVNRGRFPTTLNTGTWGLPLRQDQNWGQGGIPPLPGWIDYNDWQNIAYYTVSRDATNGNGAYCYYCSASPMLTVDGAPVTALLFMPGPPPPGSNRGINHADRDNMSHYLETIAGSPTQNNDKGACSGTAVEHADNPPLIAPLPAAASCDQYVQPISTGARRDRLFTITLPSCMATAKLLLQEVLTQPCHTTGGAVRPLCQQHVNDLATCTCSAAAQKMIDEPCRNSLNPGKCQGALALLLKCGL